MNTSLAVKDKILPNSKQKIRREQKERESADPRVIQLDPEPRLVISESTKGWSEKIKTEIHWKKKVAQKERSARSYSY
jgi:hypothetical protein